MTKDPSRQLPSWPQSANACAQPQAPDDASQRTVGHKEMLLHIVLFHLVASLTSEDHQFADHVSTTEVDTWVRLRVALFLGSADSLRERYISSNLVEDKVQRSRG